ncbi:hypothetical protein COLO4_11995 [Corchorus olitorius]|uniref:Uncharacterized protein n=1 Tax=Corchorus olitorius TaxID=93759 RepID=A0A1R3K2H3_9ROSI|nr:hypothetical protein COLO4_11995 [Corchorus olitorius]
MTHAHRPHSPISSHAGKEESNDLVSSRLRSGGELVGDF